MVVWWWIIPAVVGVVGLAIVLSGLGWMFRGKPFKGGRGVMGGGAVLAIGAIVGLIGLNVQTYNRLSYEHPIATVSLNQIGDTNSRVFDAVVVEIDDQGAAVGEPQTYRITGDQWQMDARVITWKPWANVLGLDSQYELQRIWGRDLSGARALAEGQALKIERPGIDIFAVAKQLGGLSPVEASEREFGSAVFVPMVDDASYEVRMTQEGLAVDPANDIARGAIAAGRLRMGQENAPIPQQ
jgi:hypothetical protein